MKNKKGQMFIIAAITIVTVLVLIKTGLNLTQIIENKRALENNLEKLEFENFRNEIANSISISANSTESISPNVVSFVEFSKTIFGGKNAKLQGIFVGSLYNDAIPNLDERLNITVYNFFDSPLDRINLNFSSNPLSNQTFDNISPGSSVATNFTFNVNTNRNFSLHIYYKNNFESGRTENVTILVELNKTKFVGFFDVRVAGSKTEQRDRFYQTFDIN